MKYIDQASHYMKEKGFEIPSFANYAQERLGKLLAPMKAPCYAMECEAERISQLYQIIKADPYKRFAKSSNRASKAISSLDAQPVLRSADPMLHRCIADASEALKIDKPSAYTCAGGVGSSSESREEIMKKAVFAQGYMDDVWIFIDRGVRAAKVFTEDELCFLIGFELGHTAAFHAAIRDEALRNKEMKALTSEEQRMQEMTADRAGLMAVVWQQAKRYPEMDAEEIVRRALACCSSALHKRAVLSKVKSKETLSLALVEDKMQKYPIEKKNAKKNDYSPTLWERAEALKVFAASISIVRCASELWGDEHIIAKSYKGVGILEENLGSYVLG